MRDLRHSGGIEFDADGWVKPAARKSNYVIAGLYLYDEEVFDLAKGSKRSARGEFEITDISRLYLHQAPLLVEIMRRGYQWLDTGTHDSLLDAAHLIATLEKRTGPKVSMPRRDRISTRLDPRSAARSLAQPLAKNGYGEIVRKCSARAYFTAHLSSPAI